MEYRSKKMIKQNQTYIPGKMDLYSDKDPEKSYYIEDIGHQKEGL